MGATAALRVPVVTSRSVSWRGCKSARHIQNLHILATGIAAVVLSIGPLVAMPAYAASVTIIATPGGTSGDYSIAYTVTNTSESLVNGGSIIEIEIPELHVGDLLFASDGADGAGGVYGWTATETYSQTFAGSGLYRGTAASYVDLAVNGSIGQGIEPGQSETFKANVKTNLTTNAAFAIGFDNSGTVIVDPIIPQSNVVTPVPLPSSFVAMATGLLGLLGFCRRKA